MGMKYYFDGIDYDVKITDHREFEGYQRRTFLLSHPVEKGYCFTVKYTIENNFPESHYERNETGAFPEADQANILIESLKIKTIESSN